MQRFEDKQPWNFGYTPSSYFDTMTARQQSRIRLRHFSLEALDEIHELAISAPAPRVVNSEFFSYLARVKGVRAVYMLALAAAHCKPVSEGERIPKEYVPRVVGELEKMEIYATVLNPELSFPGEAIAPDYSRMCEIVAGFSKDAVDLAVSLIKKRLEVLDDKARGFEFDLAQGILFGFPLGDVFGFGQGKRMRPSTEGLVHVPFPSSWSNEWEQNVGVAGLDHLVKTYFSNVDQRLLKYY